MLKVSSSLVDEVKGKLTFFFIKQLEEHKGNLKLELSLEAIRDRTDEVEGWRHFCLGKLSICLVFCSSPFFGENGVVKGGGERGDGSMSSDVGISSSAFEVSIGEYASPKVDREGAISKAMPVHV